MHGRTENRWLSGASMAFLSDPVDGALSIVTAAGLLVTYHRHGTDRGDLHPVASPVLAVCIGALSVLQVLPSEPRWAWLGVAAVLLSALAVETYTTVSWYFAPILRHCRPFGGR
ncbi:hypothetical protein [Halolamina salifodinae]|uniref:Uncharacterized protein n=1 Tax=Halolamina salifodinae TaxID=1202767 RepID=A0A8T4GTB2_9EURY|nr:hypothetical protein [Halolamina salifodinae]MBP1986331.1 hypothetical protein [Halolamina salifodinae]